VFSFCSKLSTLLFQKKGEMYQKIALSCSKNTIGIGEKMNRQKTIIALIIVALVAVVAVASFVAVNGAQANQEFEQNMPKYDPHQAQMPGLNNPTSEEAPTDNPEGLQR
jgi:flagellar basal body-associated protein FliL